ncbi:MAG: hypothetical protein EOO68_21125 [Moraxellaceae bacterium]|nr:MAG: hypothetical protein EOO68_21125 [Moraxellaceae bacterium]
MAATQIDELLMHNHLNDNALNNRKSNDEQAISFDMRTHCHALSLIDNEKISWVKLSHEALPRAML